MNLHFNPTTGEFTKVEEVGVLTLETVLCDAEWFGLTTASPLQRAICRIADGVPLDDLAKHVDVVNALGCSWQPEVMPAELYILAAIRTGKSLLASALAVRATQTCDVSRLRPGEIPRVSIVSLKLDLATVVYQHLLGAVTRSARITSMLCGEPTADSITLRHPSGTPVEVKIVAGARAGASLVARWSAGSIFDEFPRMVGSEDGVINFDDARKAVLGRMLPGAQLVAIGSPWAAMGPAFEVVTGHHGKPSADVVVLRATGPAMWPENWTPEACADLQRRDPVAFKTDVLGEFLSPDDFGHLDPSLIEWLDEPPTRRPGDMCVSGSDLGMKINSSAQAIGFIREGVYHVAHLEEWRPGGQVLQPSVVCREQRANMEAHGCAVTCADGHYRASLWEAFLGSELVVADAPATAWEPFARLRTLMQERKLKVFAPALKQRLEHQLRSTRLVPTKNALTVEMRTAQDGSHCDLVAALALMVWQRGGDEVKAPAARPPPGWTQFELDEAEEEDRLIRGESEESWYSDGDYGAWTE